VDDEHFKKALEVADGIEILLKLSG